jgi:hypothetical protein
MLYEGPKEQDTHTFQSYASSCQTDVSYRLYFVRCIKEYVDVTALDCTKSPGAREVTLVQMSFTNCDIWIALPGDQVTFVEVD